MNIVEEFKQIAALDREMKRNSGLLISFDRLFAALDDKDSAKRLRLAGMELANSVKGKWTQLDPDFDRKIGVQVKLSIGRAKQVHGQDKA